MSTRGSWRLGLAVCILYGSYLLTMAFARYYAEKNTKCNEGKAKKERAAHLRVV